MPQLTILYDQITHPTSVSVQGEGYLLWMVWHGEPNPVVTQAMQDYGGIRLAAAHDQNLWYFFSSDVFLAAARLDTWAKFNSLAVSIAVLPTHITVGDGRKIAVTLPQDLRQQEMEAVTGFHVWIHESTITAANSVAGISFIDTPAPPGLKGGTWSHLQADARLPYTAALGWYAILRPLGNPLDKTFQAGWRNSFDEIEQILQRHKFRYTIHDFFLMFPLESLRQLKVWCNDFLSLVQRLKAEDIEKYWPCALAIVDKKGLTFNNDLPAKIALDWDQLAADYPHMNFRNALLLGSECMPHEVRFAAGQSPDDWCNVSLVDAEEKSGETLPLLVPTSLVLGKYQQCFYCGHRGHELTTCPTRLFPPRDKDVWKRVAALSFTDMREAVKSLDETIQRDGIEILPEFVKNDTNPAIMARALYDIDVYVQLRSVNRIWRVRGKIPPLAGEELPPEDNNPIWEMLNSFADGDKVALEKAAQSLSVRFPRDFRIRSLQGFIALERGDMVKAAAFWKEAEGMSPAGFLQAWHAALQGRIAECTGKLSVAGIAYDQALRACPQWLDPQYRKIICQIKTGFADKALTMLYPLLLQDPHYFNRALLDPEVERGQIQILTGLSTLWRSTEEQVREERPTLERLRAELATWFTPEHPFAAQAESRIGRLLEMSNYRNYVPYQALIQGRIGLERDMQQLVTRESREFRNRFRSYLDKLAVIRDEAAWFPFPRVINDFNKNYNQCAVSLNWALQTNLNVADSFRKAQLVAITEEERISKLEKRLRFLLLIRDMSLFCFMLMRSFFWLEVAGLLMVLVALPLAIFYGEKNSSEWVHSFVGGQRWQIQKAATFLVSFLALGISLLRTVLRFDKMRAKVLTKAREDQAIKAAMRSARQRRP